MLRLSDIAELKSGTSQYRTVESSSENDPIYYFYGQSEMENDLSGVEICSESSKRIRTKDRVMTLEAGALVYSLASGNAAIVSPKHSGYLLTQNYVKFMLSPGVDARYLAYLLNENAFIRRQLTGGLQGSATLKFTVKQLSELQLPDLPSIEQQRIVGALYFNQLKLAALKKRLVDLETKKMMGKLKEIVNHE
ncbi:restriction endonuclease subunit S [Adlercreutzia murintestinalis]|uniref:restriction endonuclease subunit S n=1 Tax=Adlercreutzia murintestinalis TaxID=2941325 RepID=UPI00203F5674|nr:restriction endonuclease subunit S [Adlercreutzia murintestinalis]